MVQERNLQSRKIQEPDLDRQIDSRPVPPARYDNSGTPLTDIASGLALLLSLISFFLSCYAAIQVGRRAPAPAPQSSTAQPASRPLFPFLRQAQRVEPGRFLEPTEDGAGEVELLSATRSPATDRATIQLRVRRSNRPITGVPSINLGDTIALNSRTNEQYPVTQTQTPGDQFIVLTNLRPGSSLNASVTVRVPSDLDRIDLDIPNVRVFRNVPISIG